MSGIEKKDESSRNRGLSATYDHDYSGVPTGEYDDDRAEKPWQRVPSTLLILVLGFYLLLAFLTQLVEDSMPTVIQEVDVARDNSDTFSEEVALRYLHRIVGDEPRVSGTAYHLYKAADLKAMVDEIAADANQVVRTDWQFVSGDYWHNSSASFFNVYRNVSNIIALLEGESGFHQNGTIGSSVLINCHYDSVPYALGASDNAVFCSVMAEALTKLSRSKTKLKRNIVFLFNGAEENGLQGSHGFLHHPWSKGVVAVINLDAAGMNGKPTIFQASDPRVLGAYRRAAPRPSGQGLAEFLFKTGIIPSDTDFRIWRDFGDIHGIDIAFSKWAHVYHTRNDRPDLILPGVLQGAGDMILRLLQDLGDMEGLDTKLEPSSAVYVDYLNVAMVTLSSGGACALDVLVALLALASVAYYVWLVGPRKSTVYKLLYAALGRIASMLAGILCVVVLVAIMVATTIQLRYLTHPWLVVPLYWLPYLIAAVATSQAYDAWTLKKNGLSRPIRSLQAMAATRLILAVVLLVMACIPALSSARYLLSTPLFFMTLTSLVSITVVRYVTLRGWQQLLLEVVLSLPAVMFLLSLVLRLDAMMLPTMGRSASDHPDYTVAMLNLGLVILVSTTISGIELLFSRKHLWLVLSGVGAVCVVLMFIPFSPYDDELSVQRHYWFHSEIASFDLSGAATSRTSGVLVTRMDPYSGARVSSALARAGRHVSSRTDFRADCLAQVHCGLPLFRTSTSFYLDRATFLYTGAPAPFSPPAGVTLAARSCQADTCNLSFVFTGGYHNMITFWVRDNVTISAWSLSSAPRVSFYQQDRPVYVVYHSTATYSENIEPVVFNVTFNVPSQLQSQAIVDLSHHSHKIHHPQDFTDEYRGILEVMPTYFNIATFISFRYNYVF